MAALVVLADPVQVRILAPQLVPSAARANVRSWHATRDREFSETEARAAIASSRSFAEALRKLGMRAAGGNWRTLKRYAVDVWKIPIDHFDAHAAQRTALGRGRRPARPLAELLTEDSQCARGNLKRRLYQEGVKARRCELSARARSGERGGWR